MKRELSFTPVDLRTWNRGEVFVYFSQMAPTGYSLTVKVDVTRMKAALDEAGLKFFPAYVWLVTKVLNRQQAFRMAEKDGQTGFYSHLTPLYATFHEQDKTFSLMWTEYDEDFGAFYEGYLFNQQTYGANQGILARKDTLPPPNAYTVSCVPWISFAHFAVHSYNKPYYFPSVEAGRFVCENGRLMLPLSITCHHAATDGYHVSLFLGQLQAEADAFAQYIVQGPDDTNEKIGGTAVPPNATDEF